ncbi:hypothetical protein [Actinomadura madurae]|uniref:hypothetical protein n=1 Tax=Actinomadura madurae TaxID=1993 RepID=UPI0024E1B4B6|nr:hypothetical protein [Actinomadura madurae]
MRPAPASRSDQPVNDTINLISGEFWGRDPHAELRWIRDNAPVYWDPHGEVWGISTYATVKDVSRHPGLFCNGQGIRPDNGPLPMMIDMDDPEHKLRRRLVSAGFTPRRVAGRRAYLERLCDEIIDRVCERGECDFVADLAAQLPLIVIGDALGFAARDRQTLLAWSDDMLRALTGGDDPALLSRAAEAFAGFNDYASAVVADRRACPRDDLISALTHATVDGRRLDHESLLQESLLILIGGDETTRHVISGGMWQLFRHPEQRRALAEDPSGIPAAVEEMLRWVSPIKNMARTATRDTVLDGRAIAGGRHPPAAVSVRQPGPRGVHRSRRLRQHPAPERAPGLRQWPALLPGQQPGPSRNAGHVRQAPGPPARSGAGRFRRARPPARQLRLRLRIHARPLHTDPPRALVTSNRYRQGPRARTQFHCYRRFAVVFVRRNVR